jgi:hypothetical protein
MVIERVATVAVEAADPGEEGREGIRLPTAIHTEPSASSITAKIITDSPVTNRYHVAHSIKGVA